MGEYTRQKLICACLKAIGTYKWMIEDHPELDPDGNLPKELKEIEEAVEFAQRNQRIDISKYKDIPNIFDNI